MNPVLLDLITRFRHAQDRGVETLITRLGIPRPASNRQWVTLCASLGLYTRRSLDGIGFYAHGYGIELLLEDVAIDWDWGDAGEPDGFDAWRLWNFVRGNDREVPWDNQSQIRTWLEEAYQVGELTRDRLLYYSPAHRAPRRSGEGGPNQLAHLPES